MAEYIEREKAFDAVFGQFCASSDETEAALNAAIEDIKSIPAADVRPVVRGKWTISEHEYLDCSVCGYSFYTGFDTMREAKEYLESGYTPTFCPNCGAYMRGESDV